MFSQVWNKYFPVIAILIKRSVQENQSLMMNQTDFERAAGGKKVRFTFSQLKIVNGRVSTNSSHPPMAKEFALLLQENELTRSLIKGRQLEFSMTGNFELSIRDCSVPENIETGESSSDTTA